jgi:hypothetical protein
MRTKVSEPVIFKEPPSRRTQIVAGSMIFLFAAIMAVAAWYLELVIPSLFCILVAYVSGLSLYRRIRRRHDFGAVAT